MNLRNHPVLSVVVVLIICASCIIGIKILSDHDIQNAKIEADAAVKIQKEHEEKETERTEERSQFWQKLVPWGDDEQEKGE